MKSILRRKEHFSFSFICWCSRRHSYRCIGADCSSAAARYWVLRYWLRDYFSIFSLRLRMPPAFIIFSSTLSILSASTARYRQSPFICNERRRLSSAAHIIIAPYYAGAAARWYYAEDDGYYGWRRRRHTLTEYTFFAIKHNSHEPRLFSGHFATIFLLSAAIFSFVSRFIFIATPSHRHILTQLFTGGQLHNAVDYRHWYTDITP